MDCLRRDLSNSMQRLSLSLVMKELHILSRLLYRGKNQHRRDKPYQRITRVYKDLKRYHAVALPNSLKRLLKSLPNSGPLQTLLPLAVQGQVNEVATTLTECAIFSARLIDFTERAFNDVHQRLCLSAFIPLNLTMSASLSRIWFCLRYHLLAISKTYDTIKCLVDKRLKLPASIADHLGRDFRRYLTKTAPEAPDNSKMGSCVALDMLRDDTSVSVHMSESPPTQTTLPGVQLGDMGVPVALNEDQLTLRRKDFALPPKLTPTQIPDTHHHVHVPQSTVPLDSQKQRKAVRLRGKKPNTVVVTVRRGGRVLRLRARNRTLLSRLRSDTVIIARHVKTWRKTFPGNSVSSYRLQLHFIRSVKPSLETQRRPQRSSHSKPS